MYFKNKVNKNDVPNFAGKVRPECSRRRFVEAAFPCPGRAIDWHQVNTALDTFNILFGTPCCMSLLETACASRVSPVFFVTRGNGGPAGGGVYSHFAWRGRKTVDRVAPRGRGIVSTGATTVVIANPSVLFSQRWLENVDHILSSATLACSGHLIQFPNVSIACVS